MASETEQPKDEASTFTEALLGPGVRQARWAQRFLALPEDWRVVAVVALLGGVLFLPYLGAVGLWDPWETHYGEVARSMIARNDYVYPYWESAWFFSKPPFTMWMQAVGMLLSGAMSRPGEMGLYTEWGMRLPFALFSIAALCLLAVALSRVVSRRVGLASAFALATMPLFLLLTRQTVTDTPFVSALVCAMACALVGQLDERTRHRSAWWYAFYVFCGVATLSKGLMGFLLPAAILGLYVLLTQVPVEREGWEAHLRWLLEPGFRREVREGRAPMPVVWAQLSRMRLLTGVGVFLAVVGPWFLAMHLFDGVDDEGKVFWYRFWIHDHFNRLAEGVHTTTPGGTFVYFIEQGGYAIFPWVAALPGAFALASRLRLRGGDRADHVGLLALLWTVAAFLLVGVSATKFHHYVFPVLPGLAILVGLFLDRLWEEGVPRHAVALMLGLVFFVLVGKDLANNPKVFPDLYVYNYERPYPTELVTRPIGFLSGRALTVGDVLGLALLAAGLYFVADAFSRKGAGGGGKSLSLGMAGVGGALLATTFSGGDVSPTLWTGVVLAATGLALGVEAVRGPAERRTGSGLMAAALAAVGVLLAVSGARTGVGADRLRALLFESVNVKMALGFAFGAAGVLLAVAALQRSRLGVFSAGWTFAVGMALWLGWGHWVDLSHHWTQRDLFWRYYRQRQPDEPIAAFLMNWRGETFYSRNTVKQIPATNSAARMRQYAELPGRKWALVEHSRVNLLRSAVGPEKTVTLIDRDLNNKFVLVTIE